MNARARCYRELLERGQCSESDDEPLVADGALQIGRSADYGFMLEAPGVRVYKL
jgi:hypothetical protein